MGRQAVTGEWTRTARRAVGPAFVGAVAVPLGRTAEGIHRADDLAALDILATRILMLGEAASLPGAAGLTKGE